MPDLATAGSPSLDHLSATWGGHRSGAGRRGRTAELAEVTLSVPSSHHWLHQLQRRQGLEVRLRSCQPTGSAGRSLLQTLELTGDRRPLREAREWLRRNAKSRRMVFVEMAPRRLFVWAVSRMPQECAWVFRTETVCQSCRFLPPDGKGPSDSRWTLRRPPIPPRSRGSSDLPPTPRGGRPRVVSVRRAELQPLLTERQESALRAALTLGYYEVPRRSGLQRVASELKVSRSATAELLRRGEARILSAGLRPARSSGSA